MGNSNWEVSTSVRVVSPAFRAILDHTSQRRTSHRTEKGKKGEDYDRLLTVDRGHQDEGRCGSATAAPAQAGD